MTQVDALQQALEAEHAAVYVLAELGGRLSGSRYPHQATLLRSAYEAHRGRRDHLVTEVSARGATAVAPEAGYLVDSGDRSASHLLAVALRTEERCGEAYAHLVAGTTGRVRRWAVVALTDSARRALTLGGRPSSFPGLPELG